MINLLPPQYKRELKQEETLRLILILGIIFLFFLISLFSILFSVKIYTQGQLASLKSMVGIEEQKSQLTEILELREKISEASQTFLKLQSFYKNRIDSTEILEKVFSALPESVYLTSLSWRGETDMVTLSGFARSREILFELRNNLQGQESFDEINFPPQNWIKPTDIDFQVIFKVNP